VPSSTSSSDRRLPRLAWAPLLAGALLILLACAGGMETALALRGFRPSTAESARAWSEQRARLDALGDRGLALVGASRILLDVDLATLRVRTGLEPVQLGIEGGSFLPVLAGLANDQDFHGQVMVELEVQTLAEPAPGNAAFGYQQDYQRRSRKSLPDFRSSEDYLSDQVYRRLRSYADGSRPLTALLHRVLSRPLVDQYLRQLPDREVLADYSRVPMPYFYYFRAFRNLDGSSDPPADLSFAQMDERLRERIASLQPVDDRFFQGVLPAVYAMASLIQQRGGKVSFVAFPTSGYVKQIDERRYPRRLFWDRFTAGADAPTLDSAEVPALSAFDCPDGSHLDFRDRGRFTAALVTALHLGAHAP
jgi:hypothetical protein